MSDSPHTVDFFVSHGGGSATAVHEVVDVLKGAGYSALAADTPIGTGSNYVAAIHEALKRCHGLVVFLDDYGAQVGSARAPVEMMNFLAAAASAGAEHRLIVICGERGSGKSGFTDLAQITDPKRRRAAVMNATKIGTAVTDRLMRITQTAEEAFGDADFAHKWLSLPNPILKNRIPIELAETDDGAHEVEAALEHFTHGDYL